MLPSSTQRVPARILFEDPESLEGDLERTLEGFRIFEKQDKTREIRLNVHKKIAIDLETKLKSIFPPPEAAIIIKGQPVTAA